MSIEHGVRTRVWRNGIVEADDFPFERISDYLEEPDCLVWADICSPDKRRLNALAGDLSLDPHAVEDAVELHERPKVSRYTTHLFLSAYDMRFDRETGELATAQVAAFVLRNAVVTVRQSEDVDMDQVVARRAITPMRELVNSMMRHADDVHPELEPYFDDLYDHVVRATEWTESLRDLISSIFETNLSLADSRLNTVMKKLTAWAAIIAVPTAVTGFYGQNVPYPGFAAHWGFWVSTVVMVVCAVRLYAIFRRKDWI